LARVRELACIPQVLRAKSAISNTETEKLAELERRVHEELDALAKESVKPTA
jgi:hypothetical protein